MTRSYQLSDQSVKKLSKFLANPKYQPPKRRRETNEASSSGGVQYAYPPSTGIPAATFNATTKATKPGTALCKLAVENSPGIFTPGTETIIVENQVGSAVGTTGKMMTIALNDTSGRWQVIVEDCTAGSTGGGINTNPDNPVPVPSPDPINEGNSKSFSLGYILGV